MAEEQTIFIVDDDPDVLASITLFLKSAGLRCQAYTSASDFLNTCSLHDGGCLVLDIRMPGLSGLELQRHLCSRGVKLPIIFITGHGDVPMAVQAMKSGAMEFLQKPFREQELLDSIYQALEFNQRQRQQLAQQQEIRRRIHNLSKRETDVMQRMVEGDMTKVIADELGLSPRTVEIHRARVMEKMHAKTLAQLVQLVIQSGELDD